MRSNPMPWWFVLLGPALCICVFSHTDAELPNEQFCLKIQQDTHWSFQSEEEPTNQSLMSQSPTSEPLPSQSPSDRKMHCSCNETYSQCVPLEHIHDLQVIPSGPHCERLEVIINVTMNKEKYKNRMICLNPEAKWVKTMIEFMMLNTDGQYCLGLRHNGHRSPQPDTEPTSQSLTDQSPTSIPTKQTSVSQLQAGKPSSRIIERRCRCVKSESRLIPPKLIQQLELFPASALCEKVEVIVTLKSDLQICVNPDAKWVKRTTERLYKRLSPGEDGK